MVRSSMWHAMPYGFPPLKGDKERWHQKTQELE